MVVGGKLEICATFGHSTGEFDSPLKVESFDVAIDTIINQNRIQVEF